MLQQGEFLPVEQAYQLEPEITDNGLQLNWTIAPGYYLYQHRFKFFDNGTPLEIIPDYPPGTSKYDDYYEKELQVYYQALSFQIPLAGLGTGLTRPDSSISPFPAQRPRWPHSSRPLIPG